MSFLDLMVAGAMAVPRLDPENYDLFASIDLRREPVSNQPGIDFDFIDNTSSGGSLLALWWQATPSLRPFLDRSAGAAYFREGRRLESSASATDWSWLHDGTSNGRVALLVRVDDLSATADILSTSDPGGLGVGFALQVTASGAIRVAVGNGSTVQTRTSGNGLVDVGTDCAVVVEKSGGLFRIHVNGTHVGGGSAITSPSAEAPSHSMVIGAAASGARPLVGWMRQALFFREDALGVPSVEWLFALLRSGRGLDGVTPPLPLALLVSFEDAWGGSFGEIAGVSNPGSLAGSMEQPVPANYPFAVRNAAGRVAYFADSLSLSSDLQPSDFAGLHAATGDYTIAIRFRLRELSGTQHLLGTRPPATGQTGLSLTVDALGSLQAVYLTDGSSSLVLETADNAVAAGTTHSAVLRKSGSTIHLYLDDMSDPLSGELGDPTDDPPSGTFVVGTRSDEDNWPLLGWVSGVAILATAADEAELETITEWLDRHSIEDSIGDLIETYATDGLDNAYTPDSIQLSGGNFIAWHDVVGTSHWFPTVGTTGVAELDGMQALRLNVAAQVSTTNGMFGALAGTNKGFTVIQYAGLSSGSPTTFLWETREGTSYRHRWWVSGTGAGSHQVHRHDGTTLVTAIGPSRDLSQRFFAHVFAGADDPENAMWVDGQRYSAALDLATIAPTSARISAGAGVLDIPYMLVFGRPLNVGELAMFREALQREAA